MTARRSVSSFRRARTITHLCGPPVYTDNVYRREGDAVFTDRAFVPFLAQLSTQLELVVIGRLHPTPGRSKVSAYPLA